MRPETDMEKIRAAAKTLLHLDIRPTSLSPHGREPSLHQQRLRGAPG